MRAATGMKLACPDDLGTLDLVDSRLRCAVCHREFSVSDGIYDLLPSQALRADSPEVERLQSYNATYSGRPDRTWQQPLRVVIAELGNRFLYSWAARRIADIAQGEPLDILDAACGDGMLRRHIASRHDYVGVDFSIRPLVRAARYYPADYFRGDLNHLPFADASFDVAVSLQSFQYLDDPATAIRQIARVLKPGGHFLLTVPNRGSFKYRLQGLPAIQRQKFDRETVRDLLSPDFQVQEISTRGLWLPFPKISIHLPGTYRDSLGLSWTTVSERLAGK
jgi:SAM-dependent methyltransferase